MRYDRIEEAVFLSRPNRFVARVRTEQGEEVCHVKNTGRCRELLIPETRIWVQRNESPSRKTALDLIAVEKEGRVVNIDSQIPNKVAEEWIRSGHLFENPQVIRPETRYGNSRFDLYLENENSRMFLEVKGVTLEEEGVVRFPDAPTQRGVKHIHELCQCIKDGYEAYIMFVIQMENVKYFAPNDVTHPEFGQALREAEKEGVRILAYDCIVRKDLINLSKPVRVLLV